MHIFRNIFQIKTTIIFLLLWLVVLCELKMDDFFLSYDLSTLLAAAAEVLSCTKTQSSSRLVVGGVFSVFEWSPLFCSVWAFLINCN